MPLDDGRGDPFWGNPVRALVEPCPDLLEIPLPVSFRACEETVFVHSIEVSAPMPLELIPLT